MYNQEVITLSPNSLAISKWRLQQIIASSKLPITFNVFPKFPLDLASPGLSPRVLNLYSKKMKCLVIEVINLI